MRATWSKVFVLLLMATSHLTEALLRPPPPVTPSVDSRSPLSHSQRESSQHTSSVSLGKSLVTISNTDRLHSNAPIDTLFTAPHAGHHNSSSSHNSSVRATANFSNELPYIDEERNPSTHLHSGTMQSNHSSKSVEEKWLEAANLINSLSNSLLQTTLPLFSHLFFTSKHDQHVSPACLSSLLHVVSGIRDNKKWAISCEYLICNASTFYVILLSLFSPPPPDAMTSTVIDSSGRLPSGLLTGTLTDLGDYDQCRAIKVRPEDGHFVDLSDDDSVDVAAASEATAPLFKGAYCLAKFRPSLPYPPPANITMDDTVINFNSSAAYASLIGTVFEDASRLAQGFYSLPIHIALCVPSTCSGSEVTILLSKLISSLHMTVSLEGDECDSQDDALSMSIHQVISLIVLIIICITVALCSLLDHWQCSLSSCTCSASCEATPSTRSVVYNESGNNAQCDGAIQMTTLSLHPSTVTVTSSFHSSTSADTHSLAKKRAVRHHRSPVSVIVQSFSLTRNLRKLFASIPSSSDRRIHFIHGTRVLTIMWIVICHTYTFGTQFLASTGSVRIEEEIRPMRREFAMQFILNGWFSVETFFFLSGFILVYIVYPVLCKTKGKLNFVSFVTLRWLRFTPSLLGLLMINFLWPLLGSGPVFASHTKQLLRACYQGWWKNLLYINNFAHNHNDICMKHTWYISADFQLHVIAYASLWLLYWYKGYAFVFNGLMIALGMVIPAGLVYYLSLPPTLVVSSPYVEKFESLFGYFYFPTYAHFTPYFLGLVTGYFIISNGQMCISKPLRRVLWLALPTLSVCIVLSTVAWHRYDLPMEPISSALYAGTHRFIWCLFIMWIAISSANEKQGVVKKILSSPFWLPLSRISFQVYMIHFTVIYFHFLTQRKPLPFTHYDRLFMSCGTIALSVVGAVVTYCLFEAPFSSLVKHFIIDRKKQEDSASSHDHSSTDEMNVPPCPVKVITVLQVTG